MLVKELIFVYFSIKLIDALMFNQSAYDFVFERTTLEWIDNKIMVEPTQVKTLKYNRSCTTFNMTFSFSQDVQHLDVLVETFKFASNEYREFLMRFMFDYCKAVRNNDFGMGRGLLCGNYTGCSMKKGTSLQCNLGPDASRSPPLIPAGSYMAKLTYLYKSKPIMITNFYVSIIYPIKWH